MITEQFAPLPKAGDTVRIHFNIPKGGSVLQTKQGGAWKRCAYLDEAHLLNASPWYAASQYRRILAAPNYSKGKGRKVCAGIEGQWTEDIVTAQTALSSGSLIVRFNPFRKETERDGCARFTYDHANGEEFTGAAWAHFPVHTDKAAPARVEVKA